MSKAQLEELRDLVEGLVYGKLQDAKLPRKDTAVISHNAGAYVAGQLREKVRG
jgi:hypothetical protein